MKPYPDLLSKEESRELLKLSEWLWEDLQKNNLGGYSDGNRPFYIKWKMEEAIERFGKRDIGLRWCQRELQAHPEREQSKET